MQLLFHRHHHHDHHHGKWDHHKGKKTYKLMKRMAKLERKLSKYNIDGKASSSDNGSSLDSDSSARSNSHSRPFHKRMSRYYRHQHHHKHGKRGGSRGRNNSSDSSSSSSSPSGSSRSPSPHHHHGPPKHHLSRSKSFSGMPSCSPPPCIRGHHGRRPPHWRHHHSGGRHNGVRGCRYTIIEQLDTNPQEKSAEQPTVVDLEAPEGDGTAVEIDEDVQEVSADAAERLEDNIPEGPEIDATLAENWTRLIKEGLPHETRESLLEKYPVSKNCLALRAPRTNEEILPAATEAAVKRDNIQLYEQNQIGTGLTALGQAISDLNNKSELKNDKDVAEILETLNEAAVILADVHYNMTKTRQAFMLPELCKKVRPVAETCEPDEFLFGNDFGEKVKDVKGFGKHKKGWKKQNAEERCEKGGKRKHADYDGEKRKFKRFESLGPFKKGYMDVHYRSKKH